MIRFTALLAIIVMALFGSAVALAEEPDATYKVEPGASVTFVTPPLSLADRQNCEGTEQTLDRSTNRCVYGAQSDFQRTVCRGPFTYSLPVDYGKLDPDVPDGPNNSIVRPNGARWTVTIPGETQIGEVFTIVINIEGVHDIYSKNFYGSVETPWSLVSRGAGCRLTKTVEVEVVAPWPPPQPSSVFRRLNIVDTVLVAVEVEVVEPTLKADAAKEAHTDTAALQSAQASRPVAGSGDYVPPSLNRCTVVEVSSPSPNPVKPNTTGYMSWCGDLGEYAPNGKRLADLCAQANVDCRRY